MARSIPGGVGRGLALALSRKLDQMTGSARGLRWGCGLRGWIWVLENSTQYGEDLWADRGEQILPPPPPNATIPGNDAARGCEQRGANKHQTKASYKTYLLGRTETL